MLALVGLLDDTTGFDTPRERYRRFLSDRASDASIIRLIIETCLRTADGQHRRALQDAVVMLGQAFGFESRFGPYQSLVGTTTYYGHWRSRHRVHLVVDVRTDRMPRPKFEHLSPLLAAPAGATLLTATDPGEQHLALCVVVAVDAARQEEGSGTEKDALRLVSIRALLTLLEIMQAGQISHDEIVRLFLTAKSIDLVVELMQRRGGSNGLRTTEERRGVEPLSTAHQPEYWLAALARNGGATAEQVLEAVVAKRHVLGVVDPTRGERQSKPGDWICFFVPGKGILGHGRVTTEHGNGDGHLRASDRFDRLIALSDIEMYESPILPSAETQRRLGESPGPTTAAGAVIGTISREEFLELTSPLNPH